MWDAVLGILQQVTDTESHDIRGVNLLHPVELLVPIMKPLPVSLFIELFNKRDLFARTSNT